MAEDVIFGSAGVKATEKDLTGGGSPVSPTGVPAAVVGPSRTGTAFVPVTVANMQQFIDRFGAESLEDPSKTNAATAMRMWLNNQKAGTMVRTLGAGDGKKRSTTATTADPNAGRVNRAGWVVGNDAVQANGNVGINPHAVADGSAGRTYLLGVFMTSGSRTSRIFSEAGITGEEQFNPGTGLTALHSTGSKPILRGILMAPSGVVLTLSGSPRRPNVIGTPARARADLDRIPGSALGYLNKKASADQAMGKKMPADGFVMLLNGFTGEQNVITASFDMSNKDSYFANALNTDPLKIEEKGHYLHAYYNLYPQYAICSGNLGRLNLERPTTMPPLYPKHGSTLGIGDRIVMLVSSSLNHNSGSALNINNPLTQVSPAIAVIGSAGIPNYEGFEDRYGHAESPWVISQNFGANPLQLFKIHALADGAGTDEDPQTDLLPNRIKMSVSNIKASTDPNSYTQFDVEVRQIDKLDYGGQDVTRAPFETFEACTLDPTDSNYIGRMIGDTYRYYDFDKETDSQRLVVKGRYPNKSAYIRLELNPLLEEGLASVDVKTVPCGFRGHRHLVTSGSDIIQNISKVPGTYANQTTIEKNDAFRDLVEPPIPLRECLGNSTLSSADKVGTTVASAPYWGVQFERKEKLNAPNHTTLFEDMFRSFVKYMPSYHTNLQNVSVGDNAGVAPRGGTVLDCDVFNNNKFTLENVQIASASNSTSTDIGPNLKQLYAWRYRRNGKLSPLTLVDADPGEQDGRFLDPSKDFTVDQMNKYLNFSFFLQGGFDGLNIFDKQKSKMSSIAVRREYDNVTSQGGVEGPTVVAYRKAIDILGETANVDIQLLAIPGIRHPAVTDYAMDSVEDRFDAMYLMDIELKDQSDVFMTGSHSQLTSISNTVRRFQDRNLDSSFTAAYFPDVLITNSKGNAMKAPASTVALGAFGLNDSIGEPWFAPAGIKRASIPSAIEVETKFYPENMDTIYAADINPITSFPAEGIAIFGNKTLYKAQSSLDRINVRRLLIEVRRRVRNVANSILFEPNRAETLAKFQAAVIPILKNIQQKQGVDRFRVVIDSSTTTQADVENNTIRGKIFLQPTKSIEFIALDFVVSNTIT